CCCWPMRAAIFRSARMSRQAAMVCPLPAPRPCGPDEAAVILCCGEALIDMLPEGGCFRPRPGGSVWNAALALGRLGAEAALLWPLSTDTFGAMLMEPLQQAGVDLSLCPRVDRPTTLA